MLGYGKDNKLSSSNMISIKYEIFDHLIYPISIKLDDNSVIQLFRKLHIMSTIDYKVNYEEWVEQAVSNLPGFTEKEAEILYTTFKVFSQDSELDNSKNIQNYRYEIQKISNTVDVRFFGLFFALQLFYQRSKLNFSIDTRDKNPHAVNFTQLNSPISSPRGKGSSSSRTTANLEHQMIYNFIKNNIKLFLRLIASDIHNTETSLNSNEFNTLKFFFKFQNDKDEKKKSISQNNSQTGNYNTVSNNQILQNNFSGLTPFFVNSTTKINIEILNEWISNLVYSLPQNNNISLTSSYSEFSEDILNLKNLSKCVTIKENLQNKFLKISHCEDSYIYINSNVLCAKISNCNNCTIFIASVTKILTIDKCENCTFSISTNLLRISNTIDSSFYTYSINRPILFGDNRALIMAPHNVYYNEFMNFLKIAKFPPISQVFVGNFSNVICLNEQENLCYHIMKPSEFSSTILPFANDKPNYLPLCPKEYSDMIKEREAKIIFIKNMIKQANLGEEQEKALHVAIQGYFREWLVSSGNIKSMTDIVKMIDFQNTGNNFSNSAQKSNRYEEP